ncbi:N-acetylneuraminate synthase family protein [Nonlabens ponticola]|uniref:N-acetylneuraminate synthase n=1 Tax=Nonlabens ponticola TaxID=2496866 RepID=A0A3S9N049_9FLAO|nr:N-acetylneuraminate synthase family protein [Nonlabens ponticola]AZQ44703.1 N-acetylneuraminate synthase [Nonlabens ponticola]
MDLIAEIAQAHDGSLGIAHSYIDALADTGITAIKFQTHIAEAESSHAEPFRVNFSYEDATRYDYWKRMQFTEEQWIGLKKHCDDVSIEFLSSPFSIAAVELLERLGVKRYKIGSGEITNLLMLDKIAQTNKPMLVSSGMSSYEELDKTVDFLKKANVDLSLFQCTTSYPCPAGEWGLHLIPELKKRYSLPVGFSDHSGDIYACLAATSLGAEMLEFHAVFDKTMFGPDAQASLTIEEIKKMVNGVKQIHHDLACAVDYKEDFSRFKEVKKIFEKTLAVNKDMSIGDVIKLEDLEAKKPAKQGINANAFEQVLGKTLTSNLKQWDFLKQEHVKGL